MEIIREDRSSITILHLSGVLDGEQAPDFEKSFHEMIVDRPRSLALDLTGLEYIDATSTDSLIKALNLVRDYGGEMVLYGLSPMILTELKQARLDTFFTILSLETFENRYPPIP